MDVLFSILLFPLFVFLFFREDRIAYKKYLERDQRNNEHILKEIKKFLELKEDEKKFRRN